MALRFKRGLADVLNPTAGTALDCGLFAGGVFKKQCWCLQYPSWCSQDEYVAARALADPSVYATLRHPPVVGAPSEAALTVPPASGEQAQSTIDELLAQQNADWQAQNLESMRQTQSGLDQFASDFKTATSGNWLLYGVLATVGLVAVVAMSGGSPRRYGH